MTPLTGKVYSLGERVGGAREPHPHVVVIELPEQCLLVPAFSSGRDEIERYKESVFTNLGLRPDQAFAEIDNSTCVRFFDARAAHPATWVVEGARPSPKEELHGRTPIGEMNDAGLLKIVTVLVALTVARPDAVGRIEVPAGNAGTGKRTRPTRPDSYARDRATPRVRHRASGWTRSPTNSTCPSRSLRARGIRSRSMPTSVTPALANSASLGTERRATSAGSRSVRSTGRWPRVSSTSTTSGPCPRSAVSTRSTRSRTCGRYAPTVMLCCTVGCPRSALRRCGASSSGRGRWNQAR